MSSSKELDRAIQLLRAKQNEYYIDAVKSAMQSEQQRKLRLVKVVTHVESKRLEKQFAKERKREKEWLQQIQEDHALLLRAKIADWKANGVPPPLAHNDGDNGSNVAGTTTVQDPVGEHAIAAALAPKKSPSRKMSKETLSRLATPRVTVQKVLDGKADTCGSMSYRLVALTDVGVHAIAWHQFVSAGVVHGRPSTAASASAAARHLGETSQDVQFFTDIYRKQDRARLHRAVSLPALNAENLRAMTETDLLHKKMHLLQQLHGVVSQQERIIVQDDQCTVHSSVSSWKSADFKQPTTA